MELRVTQTAATCVLVLSLRFKPTHLILDHIEVEQQQTHTDHLSSVYDT